MSKLLQLKEWVTLADAAKHLSAAFSEEVTVSDLLQLALDRRITLSCNFVNHGKAHPCRVVNYSDEKLTEEVGQGIFTKELLWFELPEGALDALSGEKKTLFPSGHYLASLRLGANRYLNVSEDVTTLRGIFDLPMVGGERLDISYEYHQRTGGPEVTLTNIDGAFVSADEEQMYQLLEDFDDNEYQSGSNAQLRELEAKLATGNMSVADSTKAREEFQQERVEFLKSRASRKASEKYYPASGLPSDAVLVVRTSALLTFLDDVSGRSGQKDTVSTKERNTFLCIIAALCKGAAVDYSKPSKAAGIIREIAHRELGVAIGDTTIENCLKKIPEALEARTK